MANNCEFCRQPLADNLTCYGIGDVIFHTTCFRDAVRALAKNQENQPKPKVKVIPESPPEFMIRSEPREHYKTYDQALAVAKKLARDTGKSFWIMKHIASVDLV